MNWNYSGKADVTIGEIQLSNTAKIILIILSILLCGIGIISFIYRNTLYDYIANPKLVLTEKEVTIEVFDSFNEKDFVLQNDRLEITYPKPLDTSKIGDYTLVYKAKNSLQEFESSLLVRIVDKTPPILELKDEVLIMVRGEQTESFNPKDYVQKVSDNYDKNVTLKISENINLNQERESVVYTAIDSSGNKTSKTLNLIISSPTTTTTTTTTTPTTTVEETEYIEPTQPKQEYIEPTPVPQPPPTQPPAQQEPPPPPAPAKAYTKGRTRQRLFQREGELLLNPLSVFQN